MTPFVSNLDLSNRCLGGLPALIRMHLISAEESAGGLRTCCFKVDFRARAPAARWGLETASIKYKRCFEARGRLSVKVQLVGKRDCFHHKFD